MDYVIGSVAALISGNVTPNRPKLIRKALTPTKHQASPNVTPKSEFVEDRTIFLSPTQQKKKAIVKKSPKRIFQNPDLDITEDCERDSSLTSPKAEKVKKHLKDELEADDMGKNKSFGQKSPKDKLSMSLDDVSEKNTTPKKKKKKRNSESNVPESDIVNEDFNTKTEQTEISNVTDDIDKSPKKKGKQRKSVAELTDPLEPLDEPVEATNTNKHSKKEKNSKTSNNIAENNIEIVEIPNQNVNKKKNKKKNKKSKQTEDSEVGTVNIKNKENKDQDETQPDVQGKIKKKKKNRKDKPKQKTTEVDTNNDVNSEEAEKMETDEQAHDDESESEEVKSKNIPNPNAITEKDSDSEHDSDNEIESENEQSNEKVLANENEEQDQSSDEDEKNEEKNKKKPKKEEKEKEVITEEEIKRTLFVGNVPFSSKCKKEIKKIFLKYGPIETIRIRTIPVKDARVTPKLAVIKNELHPDRTTVNVYIKYVNAPSVNKALGENNATLNGNHLRVSRSDSTGKEHDPRCAVFLGNLPFAIEDETLRKKFEKCGEITSVRVIRDRKTNAGKGFGYVNFESKDGVELALALSEEDLTIKNRIIRVKRCSQAQSQGKRPGGEKPKPAGRWNQGREQGREEGAARRLMHKRKQQETGGDGPPNKKQNVNQPIKEKKPRKEFVGTTAEKKKKHKFDKGQKKKKALSEILTKKA